ALGFLRRAPSPVLLAGALAVLLLHPLLDVSGLPLALRAVLYEPVRTGEIRSLYPIVPWIAIIVVGYVAGRDSLTRKRPARLWLAVSLLSLVSFFVIRVPAAYGNAYPHQGFLS